jgi:hypothetical protein
MSARYHRVFTEQAGACNRTTRVCVILNEHRDNPGTTTKDTMNTLKVLLAALSLVSLSAIAEPTAPPKGDGPGREEIRKRREELEKLTPEERAERMKARRQKATEELTSLRAKKEKGELSEAEAKKLERIEARLARRDGEGPAGGGERPARKHKKPAGDSDSATK